MFKAACLHTRRRALRAVCAGRFGAAGRDAVAANKATVQKYCVSCHNEKVKSGGLTLSTLDLARVADNPEPGST